MSSNREKEALSAYIKLLKNKGATEDSLKLRQDFLLKLAFRHEEELADSVKYREAVEGLLESTDRSQWPFCLAITREYYPFWANDIKAIAAMNADHAFDLDLISWTPQPIALKKVWDTLDTQKFELSETWPMKAYIHALRNEGASQAVTDTRIKLIKLILVRLKDAPEKTPRVYRIAIDATYPLFDRKETRRLFLAVVREFYYFWIGAPDASKYIMVESDDFVD